MHYAVYRGYYCYYRRGTPNSDGTITWSADEQTVLHTNGGHDLRSPYTIAVDSNGYAFIGGFYYTSVPTRYPVVFKNANNNGTWSTQWVHELNQISSTSWAVSILSLTNGKMYAVYCYTGSVIYGKLYDGSSWGSEETDCADYNIQNNYAFSVIADGDDVHFVYIRQTTYQIRYNKRTYGTGWGANDVLVQDSMEATSAPALSIDPSTGNLYSFWIKIATDHIYYKKCVSGTWDSSATDWIDESTDTIQYGSVLNCFFQSYGNYIGLTYVTKSASPYNVKFAYLTLTGGQVYEISVDAVTKALAEVSVIKSPAHTICTVTNPYETQCTFQRKAFYANGRFWVFYADYASGNFVYRTSTDGISWLDPTVVRTGEYGPHISIFFDGTYLHYAHTTYGSALYYRRGTPNSDGTITWSASEQTVNTDSNNASNPFVSVDSNGYAWIAYREGAAGARTPWVIKSGNNNGTWGTTPTGFPYQLSTIQTSYWGVTCIPLTNGKMLLVYAHHFDGDYDKQIKMRAWDGSDWLDEISTTSGVYHSMHHSEAGEGGSVHIVFLKYTASNLTIVYTKYDYSSNTLSDETIIQDDITSGLLAGPILSLNTSNGNIFIFWVNYPTTHHVYYRKWNGSDWETTVDWIDESADNLNVGVDSQTCFYQTYSGYVGLLYMTKTASPYNVKFAFLAVQAVYEIYVEAIAKSLSIFAPECTFNIQKDASVKSQADKTPETTFNIEKDAITKTLADVLVEIVTGIVEIFKDAITITQAIFTSESTFNVNKDAMAQALTQVFFEVGISKDAIVKVSATGVYGVTFTLPLNAVVNTSTLSALESTFNINPEARLKVLAEVSVVKEGEVKITKLFLILGNLAIQIQGN